MLAMLRRWFGKGGDAAPASTELPTDLLIAALANPNPERRKVAETILRQDPAAACPALESALRHSPDAEVQKAALPLLGELGGPGAIDAIVATFDLDPPLRPACLRAISTLVRRHGETCVDRIRPVLADSSPERIYLVKQLRDILESIRHEPTASE